MEAFDKLPGIEYDVDVRDMLISRRKDSWRYDMKKYVCGPCGYEYDPEIGDPDNGIEPGTAFEDLPEDWVCPICGVGKDEFTEA